MTVVTCSACQVDYHSSSEVSEIPLRDYLEDNEEVQATFFICAQCLLVHMVACTNRHCWICKEFEEFENE